MDANTKGKERLHEESLSGISSLSALPSLSEVFSGPSDRYILAALGRSARINGTGSSQQEQRIPNVEVPLAGYRTPNPPAWERLDSLVSSENTTASQQGHRAMQQTTKPAPSDNSDPRVLPPDNHLSGEGGTKSTPIDAEAYFDDLHVNQQASMDQGNLSGADVSIYEDRADLCSNERRAVLQGEQYSNSQLLEKPGQACQKP